MSSPTCRHRAMPDAKARSASGRRPRSHSATARCHRVTESSIHSPSPMAARAREADAAVPSASPQRWARTARSSAIIAARFTSRLAALPTDGSKGSSTASAYARSAASNGGPPASTSPSATATNGRARHSRGREEANPAGSAASHRAVVAPSLRRMSSSTCCSISRAAWALSPAASACGMASSASHALPTRRPRPGAARGPGRAIPAAGGGKTRRAQHRRLTRLGRRAYRHQDLGFIVDLGGAAAQAWCPPLAERA